MQEIVLCQEMVNMCVNLKNTLQIKTKNQDGTKMLHDDNFK